MKDPRNIVIEEYDYELPADRIADFPSERRDQSKLLVYNKGTITQNEFHQVPGLLPATSILVLNNTRVVEARLIFRKYTGSKIEIFCLEPDDQYPGITNAFLQTGTVTWKCLVGNASSWNHGLILERKIGTDYMVKAEMLEKKEDHFIIRLSWTPEQLPFSEILNVAGLTPLPPYIKRSPDKSDISRYQTVFADHSGSVAAPTAGLHFTPELLNSITSKNIEVDFVTLHVGAGTFKPVKSRSLGSHDMHAESFEIKKSLIEKILQAPQLPVVAVGTTTLRTLESVYWIGIKIVKDENIHENDLHVTQWEPYDNTPHMPLEITLKALLSWMKKRNKEVLITKTSLLIAPSYSFRVVSALLTNFHQPRSTLLLLVAAFIGSDWKNVYAYALANDFRFLSYGDCCLFFRH